MCSHVLSSLFRQLHARFGYINVQIIPLITDYWFQSQIQFLIWYQSKTSRFSLLFSKVSQFNFGIFFFRHCHLPRSFLHSPLLCSTSSFQWQKQQRPIIPLQRLHLLHKIHTILVILCSCILEKIQEQFSLLNHWLEEKTILLRRDQWGNLWLPRTSLDLLMDL